jgi:hypothetical protein
MSQKFISEQTMNILQAKILQAENLYGRIAFKFVI